MTETLNAIFTFHDLNPETGQPDPGAGEVHRKATIRVEDERMGKWVITDMGGNGRGRWKHLASKIVAGYGSRQSRRVLKDRHAPIPDTRIKTRKTVGGNKILSFKFRECSLKEFGDGYDLLVHPPSEAGHTALATTLKAGYDLVAAAIPVYVVVEITDHPEAAFFAERLVVGRKLHGIRSEWARPGLGTAHSVWGLRMPIQSVEYEGSKLKLVCYQNKAEGVTLGLEGSLDDLDQP